MTRRALPVGKLPPPLLAKLLAGAPAFDARVIQGPAPGIDCAVIDLGAQLLVLKSDPITFATEEMGWYLVQVNANDIATTGAIPRWLLLTLLLPDKDTTESSVMKVVESVYQACEAMNVSVVGGHSEVTYGLDRPLAIGTMVGEVERGNLIMPDSAEPGDRVLLTKGVAIEATAILAREFGDRLEGKIGPGELGEAKDYLFNPGISVLVDAQIAVGAGKVSAMHDPTEGGLWSALWEMAEATGKSLVVNRNSFFSSQITMKICRVMSIDPYAAISSGALLLTAAPGDSGRIADALIKSGIRCADIGFVEAGPPVVWEETEKARDRAQAPRPRRDEIARLFEELTRQPAP